MSEDAGNRVRGSVLLVGSLPFDSVEEALRAGAGGVGHDVSCLPDGEVGDRKMWVGVLPMFTYSKHPDLIESHKPTAFELTPSFEPQPGDGPRVRPGAAEEFQWTFRARPGVDSLRFDDLGYARWALSSYPIFQGLRDQGVIPAGVRFQVAIPGTSSGTDQFFDDPEQWPMVHAAYAAAVHREIARMLDAIPAEDLVVQFDFAWEVDDLSIGDERYFPFWPQATYGEKFDRHTGLVVDLANGVPDEVALGFHWCYGTWGGWPMVDMPDVGLCVALSNDTVSRSNRPIDYVHMPVVESPDDAFFAPLADLDIGNTKLYLGLVHADGVEGCRRRIDMAERHRTGFGIAAVCGYGREDPAKLPDIMALHHDAATTLDDDK
jgi:hypothetical protein